MSAGDRDTLAEVIAEAIAKATYETVGHDLIKYPWDDDTANEAHKAKYRKDAASIAPLVADVITSSDWLREQRTETWKAGHGWCDDGIDGMCDHEPFTPNPYLED